MPAPCSPGGGGPRGGHRPAGGSRKARCASACRHHFRAHLRAADSGGPPPLSKVKLRIAEAMSGFVLDWLREGKIDLGVLYRTVSDRRLGARLVLREDLCLLGPAAPLAPEPRLARAMCRWPPWARCRSSCRAPATACAIFWTRARRRLAPNSPPSPISTPTARSSCWWRRGSAIPSCRWRPCAARWTRDGCAPGPSAPRAHPRPASCAPRRSSAGQCGAGGGATGAHHPSAAGARRHMAGDARD